MLRGITGQHRNVHRPDSPTKWANRALGLGLGAGGWEPVSSVPGLLLLPLTFNTPRGKQSNPLRMHLTAGVCWCAQVDGEAWPLLFPMATAQLCVKADVWAQAGYTDRTVLPGSGLGPGASHHCPRSLTCSLPPSHTNIPFIP